MSSSNQSKRNLSKIVVLILAGILIIVGWSNVYIQYQNLQSAVIAAFQNAAEEIVESTARASQVYARVQLQEPGRSLENLREIEEEIFLEFVEPIELLVPQGDAWIIGADNRMVFDRSVDFPYFDQTIDEFLDIQAVRGGASNYENMRDDVLNRRSGQGEYIWDTEKGREIGAWTPVTVVTGTDTKWMIGLTTPLSAIMDQTGAIASVRRAAILMTAVTIVVIITVVAFLRGQRQVVQLQQKVVDLQIKIDKVEKAKQVNAIVDTDYFKDLRDQAKVLRQQSRQRRQEIDK